MPLYEYECHLCEHIQDTFRSIADRHDAPECDNCSFPMTLMISAVRGNVKFPSAAGHEYISPTTGKAITTQRARVDDLKRSGCRPYEGFEQESKHAKKVKAEEDKKADVKLEDNIRRAYHQLSPSKRRTLETAS